MIQFLVGNLGLKSFNLVKLEMVLLTLLSIINLNRTPDGCVNFQVSPGTGCAWMCNYCTEQLGPIYYFTTDVCKYEPGGCVGNPVAGVQYTCCPINYYYEQ